MMAKLAAESGGLSSGWVFCYAMVGDVDPRSAMLTPFLEGD